MINAFEVVIIIIDIITLPITSGLFIIALLSYINKRK